MATYRYIPFTRNLLLATCARKKRRGRLVNLVEKASLEKIHILLEVAEQERHHEVLLTVKNLSDVSFNQAPYNLLVIPRSLPSEIVDGEHFVTADLLRLLSGNASPSGDSETEVAGQELVISNPPRQPSSASEDSGPAQIASSLDKGGSLLRRLPTAMKGARPTPRVHKKKKGIPGR